MKYDENFHIILPVDKYESMVEFFLHSLGGKIFKKKLNDFAKRMDVHFNMVRIKNVKTICVHELAHLKQMNHSKAFWDEVAKQIPDYKQRREELKRYI